MPQLMQNAAKWIGRGVAATLSGRPLRSGTPFHRRMRVLPLQLRYRLAVPRRRNQTEIGRRREILPGKREFAKEVAGHAPCRGQNQKRSNRHGRHREIRCDDRRHEPQDDEQYGNRSAKQHGHADGIAHFILVLHRMDLWRGPRSNPFQQNTHSKCNRQAKKAARPILGNFVPVWIARNSH